MLTGYSRYDSSVKAFRSTIQMFELNRILAFRGAYRGLSLDMTVPDDPNSDLLIVTIHSRGGDEPEGSTPRTVNRIF